MDWESALIGLLGSVVIAIIGYYGVMRKTKADENAIVLTAWKELLDPLKQELQQTKQELQQTKNELTLLRIHLELAEKNHRTRETDLLNRIRELENINSNR